MGTNYFSGLAQLSVRLPNGLEAAKLSVVTSYNKFSCNQFLTIPFQITKRIKQSKKQLQPGMERVQALADISRSVLYAFAVHKAIS